MNTNPNHMYMYEVSFGISRVKIRVEIADRSSAESLLIDNITYYM